MFQTKLKVAIIGAKGFPARGGAARSNEEIYCRLVDKCDVTVYAMSTHANQKEYHGIKQIIIKVPKHHWLFVVWSLLAAAVHAVLFGNYDVVHVNHLSSGFIVPLLRIKYKVLLSVHGMGYDLDDKWSFFQRKLILSYKQIGLISSNVVTTVEKSSVQVLQNCTQRPVAYIPNGVTVNSLDIVNQESESIDTRGAIVFAAARIIRLKGLHDLLAALRRIEYDGKIIIIGDLDQVDDYKSEIIRLSKGLNCEFTGLISDKDELFETIGNAQLFVFPSYTEGMSNMLLEVSSLRVPIIASDIIQNRDVFSDNEVLFFKCGIVSDLSSKIKWALVNSDAMRGRADLALQRVLTDYNWDNIAKEYYRELVKLQSSDNQ